MTVSLAAAALSLTLAASKPATSPSPAVAALVERCVVAYGGEAALAKMARSQIEGSVTSVVLRPGATGRIARVYERPGKLRVEIAYAAGDGEIRVLDGGKGWRDGQPAEGPRLDAMVLQAARLDLPALLRASHRLRDGGTAEVGGRTVRLVAVEPRRGLLVEAAIDLRSGRILRSRAASTAGPMPLEFVTTYSEFRTVDGVLVPMREENWANGQSTGVTTIEKVDFPETFPAETFRP
ncbi:MAG TPA: hypothetical protein VF841_03015 [Anaeromyxobacter sp.]